MPSRLPALRFGCCALALASVGWARGPSAHGQFGSGGPILLPPPNATRTLATSNDLGGADRYLTHVSTDKPLYRTGETVYVRGVVLNARTREPLPRRGAPTGLVELVGPRGDVVASAAPRLVDSVAGFAWTVPPGLPGGAYRAIVRHPETGHASGERSFDVRAYRVPRLKSQIAFLREGYGPGDTVTATLRTERAEGGEPVGAKVSIQARVDGTTVHESATAIEPGGLATVRFALPKQIARGEGTLAFVIDDGGGVETAAKSIPILLKSLDVTFHPEGGDLAAGLPNRVYVSARTPAGKPADVRGSIVDRRGRLVAGFRTEHEGRGRFELTPERGDQYSMRVVEPPGLDAVFPLPPVREATAVLRSESHVVRPDDWVTVRVTSSISETLTVQLRKRERELSRRTVAVKAKAPASVRLDPGDDSGVLVVTVWRRGGIPLAERLVFRRPRESVSVAIEADAGSYTPGDRVRLTVRTADAEGRPVPAMVGLTVTDDSVLELIEKREQPPRLPAMALLEDEVRDLADAHVYFDPGDLRAALATDLLLGTQGWRRFAFLDLEQFLSEHGSAARRVVAFRTPPPPKVWGGMAGFGMGGFGGGGIVGGGFGGFGGSAASFGGSGVGGYFGGSTSRPATSRGDGLQSILADALASESARARLAARAPSEAAQSSVGVVVREHAHALRPERRPFERTDFTETIYWAAAVETDPETGEAEVSFHTSDSITGFRVLADAFTDTGALGSGTALVESTAPFSVEPKLPLAVSSGDVIRLPLSVANRTSRRLSNAAVTVAAPGLRTAGPGPIALAADARGRLFATLDTRAFHGSTTVRIEATADSSSDAVVRPLTVRPVGFPAEAFAAGIVQPNGERTHEIAIPEGVVPGSLSARAVAYPTSLARMMAAMEALVREPHGCFEQTSSTTYPLVMAKAYFNTHPGVDPAIVERASSYLDQGYKRLLTFEARDGGFELFGGNPGDLALTAYGLLQFTDMAAVRDVDPELLRRTRAWLLSKRDGKGGYDRKTRGASRWSAPSDLADAYVTWALARSGSGDLSAELAAVRASADKSANSYLVALAANVLHAAGDADGRDALLARLVRLQSPEGFIDGATQSSTGGQGESLVVETTALAALAWLADPDHIDFADRAVNWLATRCRGGSFGSTHATVRAVQAIVAHERATARPKAAGSLTLLVDGRAVGEPVAFGETTQGEISLPDLAPLLTPGRHRVTLRLDAGSPLSHAIRARFHVPQPDSSDRCALRLEAELRDRAIAEGAVTEARVRVSNVSGQVVPAPIALIGIPGGLEPRHEPLKDLVRSGTIAAYEVIGADVALYWRDLGSGQTVEFPISMVAAVPGEYAGPASRAYLYYAAQHKQWIEPLKIRITPRE